MKHVQNSLDIFVLLVIQIELKTLVGIFLVFIEKIVPLIDEI